MAKKRINSKDKGNRYELDVINMFKDIGLFPDAASSRDNNRQLDARKVDLVNTNPFRFQCKHVEQSMNLHETLQEMEDAMLHGEVGTNIVLHKRNRKGTIVAMSLNDFIDLII